MANKNLQQQVLKYRQYNCEDREVDGKVVGCGDESGSHKAFVIDSTCSFTYWSPKYVKQTTGCRTITPNDADCFTSSPADPFRMASQAIAVSQVITKT